MNSCPFLRAAAMSLATALALFSGAGPARAAADQLEMDVITVYGKESYRMRKEVFELLAPLKKDEMSKLQLKKYLVEPVDLPAAPAVTAYETTFPVFPSGDIPTVTVVKTGVLLYFMTRKPALENLHLEFVSGDGVSQDFYLKRVQKDQYVEASLPPGLYRLRLTAEDVHPAVSDSIVIRPGQISLAIVSIEDIPVVAPPVKEPVVVAAPPPPPPPEKKLDIRLLALRKRVRLPEAQPVMVTRGRLKFRQEGLPNVQVRLYEREVGFFNPYDPNVENALLAVTVTDSAGAFEFPPIDNVDGVFEGTRDPVIVLSLENSKISLLKPLTLTKPVPYRYVIYQKENVNPDAGDLTVGDIAVDLRKERPVQLFLKVQEMTDLFTRPVRILFPSGTKKPELSRRQLEVPEEADFSQLKDFLAFLVQ